MIEDFVSQVARAIGPWAYLLVGAMAFMETGAFVGFVVPGEFTVILGGVLAGEGSIDVVLLCAIVWLAAFLGDTVSFFLGRRLGRGFLVRHGPKFRVTEQRLARIEAFFAKHGGKTVLIGRMMGFVRPVAPFLVGSTKIAWPRIAPYSLLGAGIWGVGFTLLGFYFWKSFDTLTHVIGQASLAFGVAIAIVLAIVIAVKVLRNPDRRGELGEFFARQGRRPLLRPVAGAVRRIVPVLRFARDRVTPGGLGLELTSFFAAAAVGGFVFIGYVTIVASASGPTPGDTIAIDAAHSIRWEPLTVVCKGLGVIGYPAIWTAIAVIAGLALAIRGRPITGSAVAVGTVLTNGALELTKYAIDRPRPVGALMDVTGPSFPSGHATMSVAAVALAIVAWELWPGWGRRSAMLVAAIAWASIIGLSRVYLDVHYLSDVLAGWGLGVTVYSLTGAAALVIWRVRESGELTSVDVGESGGEHDPSDNR